MDEPILTAVIVCPGCGEPVEAAAAVCQKCGAGLIPSPTVVRTGQTANSDGNLLARSVIDNRVQLLLLLFGAALVLGLPLLWYSRAYGIVGKLVITVLVLLWTLILLWLCWWSLSWSMNRIRQIPW